MRNKKFFLFLLLLMILIPTILVAIYNIDTNNESDDDNDDEECNPTVKGWDDYRITLTFSEDYRVLNYTMSSNMTYYNHFTDTDQFEYPFLYVVPSDMFENFSRAVEDPNFDHYEDPILEKVYNIITYPRWYGNDYNFYPPYLDNWSIFLCNNHAGPNRFTYSDMIRQSC